MHTVIEPLCTGCELCLPACPVDCIHSEDATPGRSGWAAWSDEDAERARTRYAAHRVRRGTPPPAPAPPPPDHKRAAIEAALARARMQKTAP
jgi:Na+-translocating ferredoxin:NAD+ oxidoreductase subunit B